MQRSSQAHGLRSVDTHIKRIRLKLAVPNLIRTVRGVGYRLVPPGDGPSARPAPTDGPAALEARP